MIIHLRRDRLSMIWCFVGATHCELISTNGKSPHGTSYIQILLSLYVEEVVEHPATVSITEDAAKRNLATNDATALFMQAGRDQCDLQNPVANSCRLAIFCSRSGRDSHRVSI